MRNKPPNSNPDEVWDFVPTCRFMENCARLLLPGGCDTCDYTNPDLLRDEDGEPLRISDRPESH